MRLRRRHPFVDLVERQLRLFEDEYAGLLADCGRALRSYNAADGDEAEERYGEFVDLVDTARDELERLRDAYALTLDEPAAAYEEPEPVFEEAARAFGEAAPAQQPAEEHQQARAA